MLRKLLKHEFRATARVMIPLYLITVLLAVLTRATALWAEMVTFDGMLGRNFLALLSGIIIFGFVLALIATFVVAVILAILRFRSNLMADEGYVMFTLPVSTDPTQLPEHLHIRHQGQQGQDIHHNRPQEPDGGDNQL